MTELIRAEGLHYTYEAPGRASIPALRGVDLVVQRGEFLAIVGHNGSGKSTLAKCLNGLLIPSQGQVLVDGHDTHDPRLRVPIRSTVGMVFQNPDNQFVTTVVEDEVAFGPENLGLPRDELRQRVEAALRATALDRCRERNPRNLSAGEKSRLAIASILAMRPACLILDESTAMLDPMSRREVLALLGQLHAGGLAIVLITHYMDEAAGAERALVLQQGQIVLEGTPRAIFAQPERLAALGLALPPAAAIAHGLRARGAALPAGVLTPAELVAAVQDALRAGVA